MSAKEDIRDIFSMLHDGTIINWTGNKNVLTLTIDCQYLAERIDKSFDNFYIDIFNVDKIDLDLWMNPVELPHTILTDLDDIFNAELEIVSTELNGDSVVISCSQHDKSFDYVGGNLTIKAEMIKIYDQDRNVLTLDSLAKICNDYWNKRDEKMA